MIESTYAIDPDRLAGGSYCHQANRYIGEGDISASYSADRIGRSQLVRKPFSFHGQLWVCVGKCGDVAEAYRLVHPSCFSDKTFHYNDRNRGGINAESDANGFYHGMIVKHRGQDFVLSGPKTKFIKGEKAQMSLF